MADMSPLPRSPDPLPEESLPGYVLRLGLSPARILPLRGNRGHRPGTACHQLPWQRRDHLRAGAPRAAVS